MPQLRISEHTSDRLIVEAGDPAFSRVLLALTFVCAGVAAAMLFALPRAWRTESFQGLAVAAVIFLVGFLAVFERATFRFDRGSRTLSWHRRRAFGSTSGRVPFDQIREVTLQTAIGNAINPKRRVALILTEGELPLTVPYAPDPDGSARALVETIGKIIR